MLRAPERFSEDLLMSMPLAAEEWGLPASDPKRWLRALDWVRRHGGYRVVVGSRAARAITRWLPPTLDTEIWPRIRVRIDLSQPVVRGTWLSGRHYESPTPAILSRWLMSADHFFDIGANYGWYSYFALNCSQAEVYSFEPNPSLVQHRTEARSAGAAD